MLDPPSFAGAFQVIANLDACGTTVTLVGACGTVRGVEVPTEDGPAPRKLNGVTRTNVG